MYKYFFTFVTFSTIGKPEIGWQNVLWRARIMWVSNSDYNRVTAATMLITVDN
jgi:ABC-type polysaccharide transport system permease subunit